MTTRQPRITRAKDSVVINHREMFDGVSANIAFSCTAYAINPGNQSLFPWLATQATGWERYRFRRLRVQYVPRCATTSSGTVVLAFDYDAADDPPANEARACSYYGALSGAVWQDLDMPGSISALAGGVTSKYVNAGALPTGLDIKTYNAGNLFICTTDSVSDAFACGKLWVDYEVEFQTPHTIPVPWASVINFSRGYSNPAYDPQATSLVTATTLVERAGPINITSAYNSTTGTDGNKFIFSGLVPGARYMVSLLVDIAAGAIASGNFSSITGLTETFQEVVGINAAAGHSQLLSSVFTATQKVASLVASLSSTAGTINGGVLDVVPVSMSPLWHIR
jgi:hypothetical protein